LFVLQVVAGPFMGSVFQEKLKVLLHLYGEMMGENQQVHYEENSKIGISISYVWEYYICFIDMLCINKNHGLHMCHLRNFLKYYGQVGCVNEC
jgi:hypothetical protein